MGKSFPSFRKSSALKFQICNSSNDLAPQDLAFIRVHQCSSVVEFFGCGLAALCLSVVVSAIFAVRIYLAPSFYGLRLLISVYQRPRHLFIRKSKIEIRKFIHAPQQVLLSNQAVVAILLENGSPSLPRAQTARTGPRGMACDARFRETSHGLARLARGQEIRVGPDSQRRKRGGSAEMSKINGTGTRVGLSLFFQFYPGGGIQRYFRSQGRVANERFRNWRPRFAPRRKTFL